MKQAVITGMGAVTPFGCGVEILWTRLLECQRGLAPLERFSAQGLRNERVGEVRGFNFDHAAFSLSETPDLALQFLLTALAEALQDAKLCLTSTDKQRLGVVVATNFGPGNTWEKFMSQHLTGSTPQVNFHQSQFQTILDGICQYTQAQGPELLLSNACASGAAAMGMALDLIRHDRADVVICGATDALALTPLAGLSALRTVTTDDILPFSANRSGTLFGEGAGVMVVESLESVNQRGIQPRVEIAGSWQDNNAHHLTAPDPGGTGMIRALEGALLDAGMAPGEVDYVNAHGTGTEAHDPEETQALKIVLQAHAMKIPVSSIKGALGHLMGVAGLVEGIATVRAIETGIAPPTLNDGVADPQMDLNYVVNAPQKWPMRCALNLSAGIGGGNACVALRAMGGE